MIGIPKAVVESLRLQFAAGARVEMVQMDDPQAPPIGTIGTVEGVDDTGSIMVSWDNGCRCVRKPLSRRPGTPRATIHCCQSGFHRPCPQTLPYSGNKTMLRLIGKYADDARKDAQGAEDRQRLAAVSIAARENSTGAVDQWEWLASAAKTYSGKNSSRSVSYVQAMQEHWNEADIQAAIENF